MRTNNADCLRFILALMVIFSHAYPLATGDNSHEPFYRFTHNTETFGGVAVEGFFVLSGFLIAGSWLRSPKLSTFLAKRCLRIWPGLIVAVLFCYFVAPIVSDEGMKFWFSHRALVSTFQSAVFAESFSGDSLLSHCPFPKCISGSIWTIKYEFLCYLGVALLGLTGLIRRKWFILLMAMAFNVAYAIATYRGSNLHWPKPGTEMNIVLGLLLGRPAVWPMFGCWYLLGVVAFVFRDQIRFKWYFAVAAMAGLVLARGHATAFVIISPICLAYLFMFFIFGINVGLHNFGKYGDFSYGIYLYGWTVEQILVRFFHLQPIPLFFFASLCAITAGALSWFAVERPFLRLKPKPLHQVAGNSPPIPEGLSRAVAGKASIVG